MTEDQDWTNQGFRPAARRRAAPSQRERRAKGFLGPAAGIGADSFSRALAELSIEDEELPGSGGQGPIVFKDGVFQIEYSGGSGGLGLDPALKGLIDSILEPKTPGGEEGQA